MFLWVCVLMQFTSLFTYITFNLKPLNKYCGTQIIFLGHKIYSYQRANPSTNAYEAAVMIISGNAQDPIIFSRISMVCADKELLCIRIGLQDENMDEDCSFDLSNMEEIDEPANSRNIELVDAGLSYPSTNNDPLENTDDLSGIGEAISLRRKYYNT